jgi:hypothetical protein
MDLANIIIESKTIETEYPGYDGLKLQLAHLTRDELMELRKKATTTKFNKKTRQPEEEVNSELFQDIYIKAVIVGWSGFKYKYLEKMLPVDTSKVPEDEYLEGEGFFEYTGDNATALMKNSNDFDNWISGELEDIENFTKNN